MVSGLPIIWKPSKWVANQRKKQFFTAEWQHRERAFLIAWRIPVDKRRYPYILEGASGFACKPPAGDCLDYCPVK